MLVREREPTAMTGLQYLTSSLMLRVVSNALTTIITVGTCDNIGPKTGVAIILIYENNFHIQ